MDNHREMFANSLADLDSGLNSATMTDCERFGITWGCREDCPALGKGECEHWKTPEEYLDSKEYRERIRMDRKIKFRGKRGDNGEWVYGNLLSNGEFQSIWDSKTADWRRVIPETVGQFTEFADINLKEVYHKDIIRGVYHGYPKTGIVEWDKRLGKWIVDYNGNHDDLWTVLRFCQGEIVGSIHDNPELQS